MYGLTEAAFAGGLKQIVAEEGFRGLYRGLGPQFVALLPNWAVSTPWIHASVVRRTMDVRIQLHMLTCCSISQTLKASVGYSLDCSLITTQLLR